MQEGEDDPKRRWLRFEPSVSIGTVVTVIVTSILIPYATANYTSNNTQDTRLTVLEVQMAAHTAILADVHQGVQRIDDRLNAIMMGAYHGLAPLSSPVVVPVKPRLSPADEATRH